VIAAHADPSERAPLAEPGERLASVSSLLDATAYGVDEMVQDYLTYSRGWGFEPEEISAEVHVWHGARDPLVPVEHALQLAMTLRSCRMLLDPDEGHHFFRRRLEEILTVLLTPDHRPNEVSLAGARALLRRGAGR
jgi:pimeloyl-ACP methyl ester carboxylesterase